jgi:hypothetical protein
VPGRRFPQRPGDHVIGEQFFQQPGPVQPGQPFRPESRPGRDAGGQPRIRKGIILRQHGRRGRRDGQHGSLSRQQSSRQTEWA